jgi:hypothetical protein
MAAQEKYIQKKANLLIIYHVKCELFIAVKVFILVAVYSHAVLWVVTIILEEPVASIVTDCVEDVFSRHL